MNYFKLLTSCLLSVVLFTCPVYAAKKNQGPGGGDEARSSELCRQAIAKANSKVYDQALALFDSSIKASAKNPLAFYNRGKVFMILGKYNKAMAILTGRRSLIPI